jgi:plasmid stabilization system protein ParE
MPRILWTEPAVADLEALRDFIARASEVYAASMTDQILGSVERLASFPPPGSW